MTENSLRNIHGLDDKGMISGILRDVSVSKDMLPMNGYCSRTQRVEAHSAEGGFRQHEGGKDFAPSDIICKGKKMRPKRSRSG